MKMRRHFVHRVVALAAALALPAAALAATVGQNAPDFELKDTSGKPIRLADYKGRHVVLEWTNPGCPFVQKHYVSQNMQSLQKEYTAQNVVWLSVNSTARSSYDYLEPAALGAKYKQWGGASTAMLLDEAGNVGKAYGARTTPHMYVIDPAGKLVYAGGIDDRRSSNPSDVKGAQNYVKAALSESMAGKPVTTATAPPYGCSVKYAS
jgi:alkyl hydroperoxide reductase subunit AhpC